MGHAGPDSAVWDHLTDGAPRLEERLLQAAEVGIRRLGWMWQDHEKSNAPYPEPLPLPADRRAQAAKDAEHDAREGALIDQLRRRQAERAERKAAALAAAESDPED